MNNSQSQYTKYIKDPFKVEEYRDQLAREGDLEGFKATYSPKYAQIKDLNSGEFWDERFAIPTLLSDQDPMTREKIGQVASFVPVTTKRLLDIGIGQGYMEEKLKESGLDYELYGVDISEESIRKVKENFKGKFYLDDVHNIHKLFKENYFDTIVALELIEHIPPTKIFSLLHKVHSLLKENGVFIISTPLNEGLEKMNNNPSGHVRTYSIPVLEKEFELSGFKVVDMETFYAFNNFYSVKKQLAKILKNKWKPNNVVIRARKV